MCGITGIVDFNGGDSISREALVSMADKLIHRGPDDCGYHVDTRFGFGFRRLSIIDLEHGNQPFYSDDKSIVCVCNGEIYNYRDLRADLAKRGYTFKTTCDVEVLIPAYLEFGIDFVKRLNGQFAIALFDKNRQSLFLARDHVGIAPLFYTVKNDLLVFGSEIKAILEHPSVERAVDVKGLDQIFTFPGVCSPTTLFKGICSLKPGHFLHARPGSVSLHEYWDLDYPPGEPAETMSEHDYIDRLDELLRTAVRDRLNADVPVGYYLSGGLDSSLIAGMIHEVSSGERHSFSIAFADEEHDERRYQRLLAQRFNALRHEQVFDWDSVNERLRDAIYFSETPLKETYNTCSLALSELVRNNDIKVILTGEGADEIFAGYVGYRFDEVRAGGGVDREQGVDAILENQERLKLWGDKHFFYEKNYYEMRETKTAIYSKAIRDRYVDYDAVSDDLVDKNKLFSRHPIHKRSYIDFKLRLADHLLADHGDRVAYRNSIEARYPFLDIRVIEFAKTLPPRLKLNGLIEKYIVRKVAERYIPQEIADREKFHFVAPGSPALLARKIDWVEDLLSEETVRRQGYFDPETVRNIKRMYQRPGFKLNLPFDTDLMIIIITFGIFLQEFKMPNLN